jgi:hypothetical protein
MSSNLARPARPLLSTVVQESHKPREVRDAMIELIGATCSTSRNPQFGYISVVLHTGNAYGRDSAGIPQEIR